MDNNITLHYYPLPEEEYLRLKKEHEDRGKWSTITLTRYYSHEKKEWITEETEPEPDGQ